MSTRECRKSIMMGVLLVGGLACVSPAAGTKPWDHGELRIGPDKRTIVHADGTPFFWLGDTAWMMIHRASDGEVDQYYADRAARGFNVTLQVALGEIGEWNIPNRNGDRPFHDGDVNRPNEPYWRFVDSVIERAERHGLYVALLPTWGRWVVDQPHITIENAYSYGRFIGQRYGNRPNIVWVLGGDRAPVTDDGTDYRPLWQQMANGIHEHSGRKHLMTYHRKFEWRLNKEPWYDIYMTGPAHGRQDSPHIVQAVIYDWNLDPTKPIVDGEPPYEDHPIGWDAKRGFLDAFDVRQGAYWSVFAGAAGHSYGHHSIWQWYWPPTYRPYGQLLVTAPEALQRDGGDQMRHVRALMESRPQIGRRPDQDLIKKNVPHDDARQSGRHIRCTRGDGYAMLYTPHGDDLVVDTRSLSTARVKAWWYNPRDGVSQLIGEFDIGDRTFDPPGEPTRGNDWVLVLDDPAKGYEAPGASTKRAQM